MHKLNLNYLSTTTSPLRARAMATAREELCSHLVWICPHRQVLNYISFFITLRNFYRFLTFYGVIMNILCE